MTADADLIARARDDEIRRVAREHAAEFGSAVLPMHLALLRALADGWERDAARLAAATEALERIDDLLQSSLHEAEALSREGRTAMSLLIEAIADVTLDLYEPRALAAVTADEQETT